MMRIGHQHTGPGPSYNRVCEAGRFRWAVGWALNCASTPFSRCWRCVCLALAGDGLGRGFGLFMVLVAAILVRETARLIVAAWLGLRLRAVLLLPIGGLFAYANPESQEGANKGARSSSRLHRSAGQPGHRACAGRTFTWRAGGDIQLFTPPFITAGHLLRSHGLAAGGPGRRTWCPPIRWTCGRLIRGSFARKHGFAPTGRAATGMGQVLALTAMIGGMVLHNYWLIIAGFFIMIGAQIEDQGVFFQSVVDTVRMREVMLTDFATLSPSDTLADALVRCVHSLQEDFPVVRGPQLVGIVSRQRIVDALRNDGNGYVQSVMSRAFQVARPEDTLGTTIRRLTAGHGLALIPVAESGRVVGIVSVQNLMSSMSLLAEQRRIEREEASPQASPDAPQSPPPAEAAPVQPRERAQAQLATQPPEQHAAARLHEAPPRQAGPHPAKVQKPDSNHDSYSWLLCLCCTPSHPVPNEASTPAHPQDAGLGDMNGRTLNAQDVAPAGMCPPARFGHGRMSPWPEYPLSRRPHPTPTQSAGGAPDSSPAQGAGNSRQKTAAVPEGRHEPSHSSPTTNPKDRSTSIRRQSARKRTLVPLPFSLFPFPSSLPPHPLLHKNISTRCRPFPRPSA
jgi:CBS domain-containing protein